MSSTSDVAAGALIARRTVALLVLVVLAAVVFAANLLIVTRQSPSPIRPRFGVDPNTARWFELATLPRVGRSTADRIIAFRETRAPALDPGRAVFQSPVDLDAVPGIGPKTVTRLAPHLRFPPDDDASRGAAD